MASDLQRNQDALYCSIAHHKIKLPHTRNKLGQENNYFVEKVLVERERERVAQTSSVVRSS